MSCKESIKRSFPSSSSSSSSSSSYPSFTFDTLVKAYSSTQMTPVPWSRVAFATPLKEIKTRSFHSNNTRMDAKTMDQERLYQDWCIFHTLQRMCQERGFFCALIPHRHDILPLRTEITYQKVPDLETFARWQALCDTPQHIFSQIWKPTKATRLACGTHIPDKIVVQHIPDQGHAPGIQDLRSFIEQFLERGRHILMIVPTHVTDTFSREVRSRICDKNEELDIHLEVFNHLSLLSPLTEFDVVPPISVVTPNAVKRILHEKRILPKHLPQSLQWAPVPQWFGLRPGDHVKETIVTPSESYPVLRRVVKDYERVYHPLRDRAIISNAVSAAATKRAES